MDGDTRRTKQYDQPRFATRPSRRAVAEADRYRQSGLQPARGDVLSQATGRQRIPTYLDYGYTDTFQGPSLQDELQPYPSLRDQQRQHQHQQHQPSQQQQQQQSQSHPQPQPFPSYESEMVYNINPQGPTQSPYEVVTPYSTRQSAGIDALSGHFSVPQYFPPNEPTGATALGAPYLTSQLQLPTYNQPGPIGRSTGIQPFPTTMTDMPPVGTTGRFDSSASQQPQQTPSQAVSESTNLSVAYNQFQEALRGTLDHARAGRLVEASRSLLEISEWLVTNARELGILRDDQVPYGDRLRLWENFNICWLAVCQKQKETLQELLRTGHQPLHTSLLSGDVMDNLGKELIQLCDRVEQYGLVDYEMGIWEEEILSVLSQCLDLIESRPEILRAHLSNAPTAAGPRS
ncbi:hypothetical protein BDV25DRAFT_170177 [Aspergillus avenaceus]|uniref:Uncharacterized protein n=1 Tax=Aspergillus avenaceus TaxID=36643 RepID=A0A5N6THP3_ASPAV|nr:hypothetical protein BDV25DRAFT_170177 [Aspergillus avenaceus]